MLLSNFNVKVSVHNSQRLLDKIKEIDRDDDSSGLPMKIPRDC